MAWSKKLFQVLLPLVFGALVLRFFFIQSFVVETRRFEPHLLHGDFVIGIKMLEPSRGDFVAYSCVHRNLCLGRIIGLAGDRLDFSSGAVLVNEQLEIPIKPGRATSRDASQPGLESTVVAPTMFFVEGDDSGEISHAQIRSVLARILISVDPENRTLRWSRSWVPIR